MKKNLSICLLLILYSFYGFSTVYEVGPGKTYLTISDAPLESLKAGDSLKIYYRSTPYKDKFVIGAAGTAAKPVVIIGVPSSTGLLPVLDGSGAITRLPLSYWAEIREVIKVGGTSTPADNAAWIVIENLEIKNARPGFFFTDHSGANKEYSMQAAAIYIEKGQNITVRNCNLHDCGNGLFVSHESSNILVEKNEIWNNGNVGSIYEHNTYTEATGIIYQFNKFGPLRAGCSGNNLKDRSAGTIVRYNRIEGGNRQLDLVESAFPEFVNNPEYRKTLVYGNLLIEPSNDGNSQICHYGGDNGDESIYRKGTLHFYGNTVISKRTNNTVLLRLSTDGEKADIRNNVIYISNGGSSLGIVDETGTAELRNNWISTGWKKSFSDPNANVQSISGNISGTDPKFKNLNAGDFSPAAASPLLGSGGVLHSDVAVNFKPLYEPASPVRKSFTSIGAFEGSIVTGIASYTDDTFKIYSYPNPFSSTTSIVLDMPAEENFRIQILDISGKILFQKEDRSEKNEKYIVDWTDNTIPAGLYFIRVQCNGKFVSSRLSKR